MVTERECQAALAHLEQEVEGFVGAAFVEVATGRKLAAHSVQPAFDLAAVSGAARLAVAAHLDAAQARAGCGALEEIVVTDGECIHFYHLVTPSVFLTVSALRSETNFAMLRASVRRRSDRLAAPVADCSGPSPPAGRVAAG